MMKKITILALAIVNMLVLGGLLKAHAETGINISGQVNSRIVQATLIGAKVKIFIKNSVTGKYEVFKSTTTNNLGKYSFTNVVFPIGSKPRIGAYVNDLTVDNAIAEGIYQMDLYNEIGAYANDLNQDFTVYNDPITRISDVIPSSIPSNIDLNAYDENGSTEAESYYGIGTYPRIPAPPVKYALNQNFPNPFNPVTNISFSIPEASYVTLNVYDMSGKLVQQLVNETVSEGTHTYKFDGTQLASGFYIYKLSTPDFSEIKKMSLVK